jgi:muramoyltetrapeptide carboxypeptidase
MKTSPLCPPALKKGDTIAVIAPSGQLKEFPPFAKGIRILEEMGFGVKFPRSLWPGIDYLSDSDENRGVEFNRLLSDPEVKGLIMMRGGYGCLRMLDQIDIKQVTRHPKVIVGFSDITVLQNFLYENTGLMSLHGPVVTSLHTSTQQSLERLFHCLTGNWRGPITPQNVEVLQAGPSSSGPLVGGNLASLVTLLGTPYDFKWDGKIVFLEDIDEPPYRIDRMLTQLFLAGKFKNINGLILGDFTLTAFQDDIEKLRYREQVWKRILEVCEHGDFPIWANFPYGHCHHNITLPLGAIGLMDREKTSLVFA